MHGYKDVQGAKQGFQPGKREREREGGREGGREGEREGGSTGSDTVGAGKRHRETLSKALKMANTVRQCTSLGPQNIAMLAILGPASFVRGEGEAESLKMGFASFLGAGGRC